ncbi:flavin monoamine oxidase family protein [Sulfurimonas aquatica]|uniref:flavin monoamine oxidase family protein n=1 Tax=Sulfurimonas aquatica TaxID=2672570 RepID=UPI001A98488C|nr:FAD-dependent oxidoreductase [Sulfurimonas aquatica]
MALKTKEKIIIIGAGISGVYLAYLLQEKYEVIILEARDRVGGRIFSIDGHDMGPSWVWPHQKNILKLMDELGLELFRQNSKGYAIYDTEAKVEVFSAPQSTPSFRVKGSLTKLIDALKDQLENVEIYLNKEVLSVKIKEGFVSVFTTNKEYIANYVISTLPPRVTNRINFEPKLPDELEKKMLATQTWMGNSAKCVVEFKKNIWQEKGLSGFMFSHVGPLGEIHDASCEGKHALFGFVNANANMEDFDLQVTEQMIRVLQIKSDDILKIYLINWKSEKFSSTKEDSKPLKAHPIYGIDTSAYSQRALFSSTEFSYEEGGYIEGAIINAKKIYNKLVN